MSTLHFWYSQEHEVRELVNYAESLAWGQLATFHMLHRNTCEIVLAGEKTTVVYNLCADTPDAYNLSDLQYLGVGDGASIRIKYLTKTEIRQRFEELDLPIPSALYR